MGGTTHVSPAKSAEQLQNLLLTSKYRGERFPIYIYASGDMLFSKFCQHDVDWWCVDVCKDHF